MSLCLYCICICICICVCISYVFIFAVQIYLYSFLSSFHCARGIISHSFMSSSQIRLFGNRTLQLPRFECQTDVFDCPFLHGGLCLEEVSVSNAMPSLIYGVLDDEAPTSTVHVPMCGTSITFGFRSRPGWILGSSSKTSSPTDQTLPLSRASTRAASSITAPRAVLTMTTPSFILANSGLPIMWRVFFYNVEFSMWLGLFSF